METTKTTTAMVKVREERTKAIWRLFETKFNADYRITVGSATCENAAGSREVYARLAALAENYTAKRVTIGTVGCTGRCDMEPVVTVIGAGEVPVKYVHVTPGKAEEIFRTHICEGTVLEEYSMRHVEGRGGVARYVTVFTGAQCPVEEGDRILKELVEVLDHHGLGKTVAVGRNTHGKIDAGGPAVYVYPDNIVYADLNKEKIDRIVEEHLKNNRIAREFTTETAVLANKYVPYFGDVHFFGKQLRMTLRNCGVIDPESIEEYLAVRGYEAAANMVENLTPGEVTAIVRKSGLRGRGGGGFPIANKWELAARENADEKYVICNADEGDPGAFMDRSIIEGDPHTVIEGMIIAGYAFGATHGFVYTRAEYPLAVERLEKAIAEAHTHGFLGKNVFGTDWHFDIEVRLGAGAFVCGEETALIASIEGYRGEPKQKPPFPTERGLWDKPTVINNVETLANLPVVLIDGPERFAAIGTPKSTGTKVFALAGKVRNTGLIEVPMGTTLREVIYDIGGGIPGGKAFKAVQTGGPAGGCLTADYLDTPIDYESLQEAGSIMGSGGMIVMDEATCMVDVAKFFLEFMVDESCGQCAPCRAGTPTMRRIVQNIAEGKARLEDLDKLEALAKVVCKTSICGLGKNAPNPVLSTLRYFRDEYVDHIVNKRCKAGVCRGLVRYEIDTDACVGCGACKRVCPARCITGMKKGPHEIFEELCTKCGTCKTVCKFNAVNIVAGTEKNRSEEL